jgi:hypothetical protein
MILIPLMMTPRRGVMSWVRPTSYYMALPYSLLLFCYHPCLYSATTLHTTSSAILLNLCHGPRPAFPLRSSPRDVPLYIVGCASHKPPLVLHASYFSLIQPCSSRDVPYTIRSIKPSSLFISLHCPSSLHLCFIVPRPLYDRR